MRSGVLSLLLMCVVAYQGHGESSAHKTAHALMQAPGFYLPESLPLKKFSLRDHNGASFELADLQQRWTLLFFGYTHCPDVCPATLVQIRALKQMLASRQPPLAPAVVFISVDPQRDSSVRLKGFVQSFGDDFLGVGGTPEAVDVLARQLRVKYSVAERAGAAYLMDHTSSVALITPTGHLRALFSAPLRPASVADDIVRVVAAESDSSATSTGETP
jgi:protein SCO1